MVELPAIRQDAGGHFSARSAYLVFFFSFSSRGSIRKHLCVGMLFCFRHVSVGWAVQLVFRPSNSCSAKEDDAGPGTEMWPSRTRFGELVAREHVSKYTRRQQNSRAAVCVSWWGYVVSVTMMLIIIV